MSHVIIMTGIFQDLGIRHFGEVIAAPYYNIATASILLAATVLLVGTWLVRLRPKNLTPDHPQWIHHASDREIDVWLRDHPEHHDILWRFTEVLFESELPRFKPKRGTVEWQRYEADIYRLAGTIPRRKNWRKEFRWFYVTFIVGELDNGTPELPRRRILPIKGEGGETLQLKIAMSSLVNLTYNVLFYLSVLLYPTAVTISYYPTSPYLAWFVGVASLGVTYLVLWTFGAHGFVNVNTPDHALVRSIFGKLLAQQNAGGLLITPALITRLDNNPDISGETEDFDTTAGVSNKKMIPVDRNGIFARAFVPGGTNPLDLGTIGIDVPVYLDPAGDDEEGVADGPDGAAGRKKAVAQKKVTSQSMWITGVIVMVKVVNTIVERVILFDDIGPAIRTIIGVVLTMAGRIVVEHDPLLPPEEHHPLLDGLQKPDQKYADAQIHIGLILDVARRILKEWKLTSLGIEVVELTGGNPFYTKAVEEAREELAASGNRSRITLQEIEVLGKRLRTIGIESAEAHRRILDSVGKAQGLGVDPTKAYQMAFTGAIAAELLPLIIEGFKGRSPSSSKSKPGTGQDGASDGATPVV
jgi:hypothetical protein